MGRFFKNNILIFAFYFVALCYAAALLINNEKVIIHIYLNQFVGNPALDLFFYYITYLGDGLVAPFLLLMILIYNVRLGLYATFSFLSATLSAQVLKRCFFDDLNRPSYIFNYIYHYPIKYVEGVERYIHNSFPSGHATQAFSILMCLGFMTKRPLLKLAFFFLALFTSMSRVYLSQHWLSDITAGSMIGMFYAILFYYVFIEKNKFERLNKPLSAFRKR